MFFNRQTAILCVPNVLPFSLTCNLFEADFMHGFLKKSEKKLVQSNPIVQMYRSFPLTK